MAFGGSDELLQISGTGAIAAATAYGQVQEMPFAGELNTVSLTIATGPVGSDAIVDVQKSVDGGTTWVSVFATALAQVYGSYNVQSPGSATQSIDASSTGLVVVPIAPTADPAAGQSQYNESSPAVEAGGYIIVGTEWMKVTAQAGSPLGSSGIGNQLLTVTRGAFGTTAAVHNGGVDVLPGKPRIVAVASGPAVSSVQWQPSPASVRFNAGDLYRLLPTQVGSTTAGTGLGALLHLIKL